MDRQPPSESKGTPDPPARQHLVGLVLLILMVAVIMWTSTPPEIVDETEVPDEEALVEDADVDPPAEQPAEPPPPTQPSPEEPAPTGPEISTSLTRPGDPQLGWLIIEGQTKSGTRSTATARFLRQRAFEVETDNVDRFSIDLARFPEAGARNFFIMHVDGHNFTVTRKGHVLTFKRSAEGTWTSP